MRPKRYSALVWQAGFDPETNEPDRDLETGRPTVRRVYGFTPAPTIEDGWRVEAEIDVGDRSSVIVESVTIMPSPHVLDNEGELVTRTVKPTYGVNSSVLQLVHFPSIRAAITAHEEKYAEIARTRSDIRQKALERIEASKARPKGAGGRPRLPDEDKAEWAEDVLVEKDGGKVGIRNRLAELWKISTKGVASRVDQLNLEGWLIGPASEATAGPTLTDWRDRTKKE